MKVKKKTTMKEKLSNLIALRNKVKTVADETAKMQKKRVLVVD